MKALTKLATAVVAGLLLFGVAPATVAVTATIFALAVVSVYGGEPVAFARTLLGHADEAVQTAHGIVDRVEEETKSLLK